MHRPLLTKEGVYLHHLFDYGNCTHAGMFQAAERIALKPMPKICEKSEALANEYVLQSGQLLVHLGLLPAFQSKLTEEKTVEIYRP